MSQEKDNEAQKQTESTDIVHQHQYKNEKGPTFGARHTQTILLFLCSLVTYLTRVNVSVAVVAMTNSNSTNPDFEEFDWNEKEKSFILSSIYWGYVITQIPGGQLSKKYGSKIVLFFGNFIASIFIILIPFCIRYGGWQLFCGIRVIQGLCQGVIFPSIHTHLSNWAPIDERNRLGGLSYSGIELGTVLAFISSGFISSSNIGWPGIFYISGCIGFLWCLLWWFMGSNNPNDHKSITLIEKKYIESSLHQNDIIYSCPNDKMTIKSNSTPWIKIFTSVPFLSLIIVRTASALGFQILLQELPTYMNSILKMNINSNALFSAFPYLIMWLLHYVFILMADIMIRTNCLTLTVTRKTFNTVGCWIPAFVLIGIAFVTSNDPALNISLLTLAIATSSASLLGSGLNPIDLAPNYAGILMGIMNTSSNIMSILAPLLVGIIVTDENDRSQWQIVFLVAAAVLLVGNLVFIILGKMDVQPWNDGHNSSQNVVVRKESIFVETLPHTINSSLLIN